jgi:hypothetical protein
MKGGDLKMKKVHFAFPYRDGVGASCNKNIKINLTHNLDEVTCLKCLPDWKKREIKEEKK